MATRTSGSGKSISEREQEIRAAEQNLAALESQHSAEIARLEEAADQLARKLQELRTEAGKPELTSSRELAQQLEGLTLPRGSFEEAREQALVARQEALGTRTRVAEKLRQQIRAHADELTRLEKQLAEHDAQLQEHLVRADLERARKERERKEERERERARERAMAEDAAAAAAAKRTEVEIPAAPTVATGRSGPKQSPAAAAAATATANLLSERQSRVRMQASVDMESESNFFQGFSTNLSEGGLFVATVQMLPRGTPVDLHFTLPGGKRIDAKGVVRWTREVNDRTPDIFPGVGVQFTDLPAEAATAIRSFVSEREPLFFAD